MGASRARATIQPEVDLRFTHSSAPQLARVPKSRSMRRTRVTYETDGIPTLGMRSTHSSERNACVAAASANVGQMGNGTIEGEVVRKGRDMKSVRTAERRMLQHIGVSKPPEPHERTACAPVESPHDHDRDRDLVQRHAELRLNLFPLTCPDLCLDLSLAFVG